MSRFDDVLIQAVEDLRMNGVGLDGLT